MSAVLLFRGQRVEEGMGPARCSWRLETGRLCTGLIGWPAVGSILVDRLELEEGEYLGECEPGLFALLCHGDCSTVAVFSPPPGPKASRKYIRSTDEGRK